MADLKFFVFFTIFAFSTANGREINNRMVGGTEAQEEQFPYQASIYDLFVGHVCGGAILNEKWIITAAHCVKGREPPGYFVSLGIIDLKDVLGAIYMIDKVVKHESEDLALIKLQDSITFGSNIKKIDLPSENLNIPNSPVTVSGWGSQLRGGKVSRKLLFMESKIYDLQLCKERMASIPKYPPVTESNICTFTHQGQGLCDGDAGSPVVADNKLIAVALYGYPCARGYPDINLNVWNYLVWIKSHITAL